MFLKSFVARALARALAFLVLFGFSLAIPSSENGTIRQPEKKKHARYDTPAPTFRHSFDFKGEKTFAFYTSGHVDLDPVRRFCVEKGGKIAITRTSEEQRAVMKHIYEADASRPWKDRKYLLGGFRGRNTPVPGPWVDHPKYGPWKWMQKNGEEYAKATTVIPKDQFLWASPKTKEPGDWGKLGPEFTLMISPGSGFGALNSETNSMEDWACEFEPGTAALPTASSPSVVGVKSPSCVFNEKKFTFHTNYLKKEEAPDFFTLANRVCNESDRGSLAMTKTPKEQNAVLAFIKAKFGGASFMLGGETKDLEWFWLDGAEIPNTYFQSTADGLALTLESGNSSIFGVREKAVDGNFLCQNKGVKSGGVPCPSGVLTGHPTRPTTSNSLSPNPVNRNLTHSNPQRPDPAHDHPQPRKIPAPHAPRNSGLSEHSRHLVGVFGAVFITIAIFCF